jgi:hypothetical protein
MALSGKKRSEIYLSVSFTHACRASGSSAGRVLALRLPALHQPAAEAGSAAADHSRDPAKPQPAVCGGDAVLTQIPERSPGGDIYSSAAEAALFSAPGGAERISAARREFRLTAREFPLRGENFADGFCEILNEGE